MLVAPSLLAPGLESLWLLKCDSSPRLFKEGWTLKQFTVKKEDPQVGKLGDHKPRIALTWLKKIVIVMSLPCFSLYCDVIRPLSVQTWFVYFFVSLHPLYTNFVLVIVFNSSQNPKGRQDADFKFVFSTRVKN